jgi:hypothetical protein
MRESSRGRGSRTSATARPRGNGINVVTVWFSGLFVNQGIAVAWVLLCEGLLRIRMDALNGDRNFVLLLVMGGALHDTARRVN